MSVNEEFLNVALHELIYKTSAKKEKRSVSIGDAIEARKTAEAILQHFQQEQEVDENTSDGYHTFKELYDHRIALFIALMRSNPLISWRANNHEDGTGFEGWFVAGMHLPTGDITYHLPDSDWTKLDYSGIATSNKAPKWDGHTANDVVERLNKWFKEPVVKHEKVYSQSEVDRLIREARIDELKELVKKHTRIHAEQVTDNEGGVYLDDSRRYISLYETKERIVELEELSKHKEGRAG